MVLTNQEQTGCCNTGLTGHIVSNHTGQEIAAVQIIQGALVRASEMMMMMMMIAAVQDWQNLFDPGNETGGQMPAIQIIWDAFVWRFGDGVVAVMMMMIPLVASYGSSMSTVTAAAR